MEIKGKENWYKMGYRNTKFFMRVLQREGKRIIFGTFLESREIFVRKQRLLPKLSRIISLLSSLPFALLERRFFRVPMPLNQEL